MILDFAPNNPLLTPSATFPMLLNTISQLSGKTFILSQNIYFWTSHLMDWWINEWTDKSKRAKEKSKESFLRAKRVATSTMTNHSGATLPSVKWGEGWGFWIQIRLPAMFSRQHPISLILHQVVPRKTLHGIITVTATSWYIHWYAEKYTYTVVHCVCLKKYKQGKTWQGKYTVTHTLSPIVWYAKKYRKRTSTSSGEKTWHGKYTVTHILSPIVKPFSRA